VRHAASTLKGLSIFGAAAVAAAALAGAVKAPSVPPAPAASSASAPVQVAARPAVCESGRARIEDLFDRWTAAVRSGDGGLREGASSEGVGVVRDAFALDHLARGFLDGAYARLHPSERVRFRRALSRGITRELLPYFESRAERPDLRPADEPWEAENGVIRARYWLIESDRSDWFTIHLVEEDGSCRIADMSKGDRSLAGRLKSRVEDLLDHSFAYMVAVLGDHDEVILEDFEDEEVGQLPEEWSWKDDDDDKNKPYRIASESGNKYLEATDEGESVILGHELGWNVHEYPYISFRVRVNRIPEGGNERFDDRVDSAAGLYFTLNKKFFGKIPESVKYVWSSTLPEGTAVRRDGIGRPWQVVFGSGREGLGEWRTYVFDLREAFRETFGDDPPAEAVGIGVLSDANSVGGGAYADYDDIRALRSAPPDVTSGVTEIVPPGNDT